MAQGHGPSSRARCAAALVAGLALAACTPAPSARPVVDTELVIQTGHGARTALVHRPPGAGPGAPLVVVLHGLGSSGALVRGQFGWEALADREGVVVAHPDGVGRSWNAGACCSTARDRGVDDVAYLDALVARIAAEHGTDPDRVYAVGFSNGAMMSYAWACARPGRLAGIGPVGGALVAPCPAPGQLTVVAAHGDADSSVPIGGGPGSRSATGHGFPTLDESLAPFIAAGSCAEQPAGAGVAGVVVTDRACHAGHHVVRVVLLGGRHEWPREPDLTALLWQHLQAARPQ